MRLHQQIHDVLSGKLDLANADASVQSNCRGYFYEGAVEILALPSRQARLAALERIPSLVRPHVENEVWRVWRLRNGTG